HALLDARLPARAAHWPRQQWDRADLLLAMLHFNDAIAQGRAAVQVATAGRRTARERPNPSVALLTEYANQHDGSPLWLWGLTPDWLLDVGTKRRTRIALADLGARQAQYEFTEVAWKQRGALRRAAARSEEHTSELQSPYDLVCRLLLEKKKKKKKNNTEQHKHEKR